MRSNKRDSACSSGNGGTGEIDELGVDVVRRNRGADPVEPGLGHNGSFVLGPWMVRSAPEPGPVSKCRMASRMCHRTPHGHAIVTVAHVGRTSGLVQQQRLHYEF